VHNTGAFYREASGRIAWASVADPGVGQRGHMPLRNRRSFPLFYTVFSQFYSQFWNFLYFCPPHAPPKIKP